jgi:glycosidase
MENSSLLAIDRIEPPFWYAGMHHAELQILFYGKNIAHYWVTVSNGIPLIVVKKTTNPNYLFVTINTKNIPAMDFFFIFNKKGTLAFTQKYELRQRKENSAARKGFDASDMIYLLMPDRFSNGNGKNNNDATTTDKYHRELPEGRHGGDIQGIIDHLDYIQELGATAIWTTPLCEDNDAQCSYHTYAQSDVYKIDPRYGTNEDYLRLSLEMHQKKMKLIMDYVINHWGLEHWMIKDLPIPDWINQFENYTETNHKRTLVHDIHASKIDTKECFDGWFVPSMPDLNQRNPLVLKYLIQNAIWWIEYADLDGLRVDTFNYVEPWAAAQWTKAITDEYPNFNIVGEISMRYQAQVSYWQKDSAIGKIQNFNSYLPSVMDFILSDSLLIVFNEDGNWETGMIRIYNNFANDFLFPNVNNLLIFAENHDTHRINQVYQNDFQKYKMTMAIIATVRGIPQLYYGSEVGMDGNKDLGDAYVRYDFPGGWEGDRNNAFSKKTRTEIQNNYFDFTSKLFQWRKTKSVLHFGKMTHYIPQDNTYVYFRHNDSESVMVLFNNSNETKSMNMDRFRENIGINTSGKDVITELVFNLSQEIILAEKSVLILELSPSPLINTLSNE